MADVGQEHSSAGCCSCRGPRMSCKDFGKLTLSYFSGVIKGAMLLPLVLPTLLIGILVSNLLALPVWLDHGYMAIRYNRLLGRNLKIGAGILYPVLVVLYFAVSLVAVVPLGVLFALWYPGFITWNLKKQSAWKHTYFWAGWNETLATTVKYAVRYYYSVSLGFKEQTRLFRRKAWKQTYDVHPLNLILALLVLWGGFVLELACMELLLVIKMPFLIFRALSNHISARGLWFRGLGLTLAWIGALPCLLIGPPLLLLAAIPWCFSKALLAGEMTLVEWGDLRPAWVILTHTLKDVHVWTARYISRYDVPFTPPPQGQPVHAGYLILGLFPTIVGLLVVPPVSLALTLLSIMPVMTAAWVKIGTGMSQGGVQNRPVIFLALGLLGLLIPVITPVVLVLLFVWSLLDIFTAWGVTHSKRSLTLGFQYPLGLLYRLEYSINKFAIAQDPREQVHWASLLPRVFALYAQPYMHPNEWDMGAGSALPTAIVGKPARYVPPGLRRPRYDEQGRLVDMTQALYEVPGVGVTRVDPAGVLSKKGGEGESTPRSSVDSEEHAAAADGDDEPDPANARFPLSGKPIYGPELLPPVYKAVLASMVVGGVVAGGLGVRTRAPAGASTAPASPTSGAAKDASGRFASSPTAVGSEQRPEVYVAVDVEDGPEIDPNSAHAGGDVAVPNAKEVAEVMNDNVGCCSWMCFSEPADGYEEEDDGPELPHIRGGETLLTPALVEEVARHKHRRASLTHIDAGHESAVAATSLSVSGVEQSAAAGVGAVVDAGQVAVVVVQPADSTAEGAQPVVATEDGASSAEAQHAPSASDATVVVLPAASTTSSSGSSEEGVVQAQSAPSTTQPQSQDEREAAEALQAADAAVKAAAEASSSSSSSAVSPAFAAAVASVSASKYAPTGASGASLGSATAGTVAEQQASKTADASQGQLGDDVAEEDDEDDEDEDDEEEDGMFILQPVVRPALPDEWVAVKDAAGATYYANYARNQSSWKVPPGVKIAQLAAGSFKQIVGWNPEGNGFVIHSIKKFEKDVLTKFFTTTKYQSFMRSLSYYGFKRKRGDTETCEYVHELFVRGDRAGAAAIPRLSKDEKKDKQRERLHPHPQIQPAYPPPQKQYAPPLDDTGIPPPRVAGQGQIGLLVGGSEAESDVDDEDEDGEGGGGGAAVGGGQARYGRPVRGGSQDGGAAAMPPNKRQRADGEGRPLILGPHARLHSHPSAMPHAGSGGQIQAHGHGAAGHPMGVPDGQHSGGAGMGMTVTTAHSQAGGSASSTGDALPGVHATSALHAGSLSHAQSGGAEAVHTAGRPGRAWPVNASGVASYYAGPVLARMDSLAKKASSGAPGGAAVGTGPYHPLPSPTYEGSGAAPDSGAAFLPPSFGSSGVKVAGGPARAPMALAPYQLQRIPSHSPGESAELAQGPILGVAAASASSTGGRGPVDMRPPALTADGLSDPAVVLNVSPHLSYHGPATSLVGGSSSMVGGPGFTRRLPSPTNAGMSLGLPSVGPAPSVLGLGPLGIGMDSSGGPGASSILMGAGGVAEGFRADRGPGNRGSGMPQAGPAGVPARTNSVGLPSSAGSAQPPAPLRINQGGVALMPYSDIGSGAGALSLLAAGAEESTVQHTERGGAAATGPASRVSKNVLHDGVPTSAIHEAGTPHPLLNVTTSSSTGPGAGAAGRADMGLLAGAASPLAGSAGGSMAGVASLYPSVNGKRQGGAGGGGGSSTSGPRPTSARMGAAVPADLLAGTPLPEVSPPGPGASTLTRGRASTGMANASLPAPPAPAPTSQVLPLPPSSSKAGGRKEARGAPPAGDGSNGLRIATPKEEELSAAAAGDASLTSEGTATHGASSHGAGARGSSSNTNLDDSLQMSPLGGM